MEAPTRLTAASVNTKSKFGIYTFAGNSANRTLSHGLGQQPEFMIVKKKSKGWKTPGWFGTNLLVMTNIWY